jgi:2'-5' RNA ligase
VTDAPATLRLFVAVHLPEAWIAALAESQDALRRARLNLRYVRPESIHLTLKFLGEVESRRLNQVTAALNGPATTQRPFALQMDTLGTFGAARRPRVVWAGLRGDLTALAGLAAAVDRALAPAGFPPESRAFRPHLTLARVPERLPVEDAQRILPAVAGLELSAVAALEVDAYTLVRSELGPGGARYTSLQSWPLAQTAAG